MKILITGCAGFIGSKVTLELANRGHEVVGIDNMSKYYDTRLKEARLRAFAGNWRFVEMSIDSIDQLDKLCQTEHFDLVVHMAAQAGVRHSLDYPHEYVETNIVGFLNVLEVCRKHTIQRLLYASSSSVYGKCSVLPFSEDNVSESPLSMYAVSKRADEMMAYTYSHLYGIQCVGLRLFSVYGPWGRPDMAPMIFANALHTGKPIPVFNQGQMSRDFTYIDDAVAGILSAIDYMQPHDMDALHRVFNIGSGKAVSLPELIEELAEALGCKANLRKLPMQHSEVQQTLADIRRAEKELSYHPAWSLHEGIRQFVLWYKSEENPL